MQILIQYVWGGGQFSAFLKSYQVLLVLLVQESHCEQGLSVKSTVKEIVTLLGPCPFI